MNRRQLKNKKKRLELKFWRDMTKSFELGSKLNLDVWIRSTFNGAYIMRANTRELLFDGTMSQVCDFLKRCWELKAFL